MAEPTTRPADPLTQVYNALWAVLEAHDGFTGLVKIANRIKYTGTNRSPDKEALSTADLPEVRVLPAGGTAHLGGTSSTSVLTQNFVVEVSTDQFRLDAPGGIRPQGIFPIKWEIYRAMSKCFNVLDTLTFDGEPIVKKAPVLQHSDLPEVANEKARNVTGWFATLSISVELHFRTASLRA